MIRARFKFVMVSLMGLLLRAVPVPGAVAEYDILESGGPLMPEQAAYDVTYYDLSLSVNPADSSISGNLEVQARIVQPVDWFVLDLDTLLTVGSVNERDSLGKRHDRRLHRQVGKMWIYLTRTRQPGEDVILTIDYHGKPRIAPNPPWRGGFTWDSTADGQPWIATSCQGEGADIWWPVKDHVSDEPDSMGIHIRVPEQLVCASNGRLRSVEQHDDKTKTYHWFVSTPINTYTVALNIAPYRTIEDTFYSISGDRFPVTFWVLPQDYEKGEAFFPQIVEHLRFFERVLGPYPFRADKYGVVQTPHLGMEHQTIIAYGADFKNTSMSRGRDWGFDALHHHELAHEWWGNLVTCSDWRDLWLHEGFGTYMQALYVEYKDGPEAYRDYMMTMRGFSNLFAIAPRESHTCDGIVKAPVYSKGAWVLHTLRYLIGDEAFQTALRRMAYPDPAMENITDGRQARFATSDDFVQIAEEASGMELDWFFEVYLRQPQLPVLVTEVKNEQLTIKWQPPEDRTFPMPVDIQIGDQLQRVEIPDQGAVVELDSHEYLVDPEHRVLFHTTTRTLTERVDARPAFPEFPEQPDEVVEVDETIEITGDFDGSGKFFVPSEALQKAAAGELPAPLFSIRSDRIAMRNVHMRGPNGISIDGSSILLDNVWNHATGKNWIVIKRTEEGRGRNITLRNCGAREASGVVILAGSSINFQIENSVFDAIDRVYSFKSEHRGVFRNNWIRDARFVVSGEGKNGQVELFENKYFDLKESPSITSSGATIQARNNTWYRD